MRIECPLCSIGFQVEDSQVGTKGRCPKCETKFIIPADPDDEIDVLEEGDLPEEKKEKSEKKKDKGSKDKSGKEKKRKRAADDEEEEPKPKPKPPKPKAKKKAPPVEVEADDSFDTSGIGKALGLLALGLVLGLVIGFALGRVTAGGESDAGGATEQQKDAFGLSGG